MENTHQNREYQGQRRKKKSSGKIYREVFDPERIGRLKSIVSDIEKQGSQKFYSILVDGETVVAKNYNANNFDNYKKYLLSNTQNIEVRMYFGTSPSSNRHIFQTAQTSLGGLRQEDVDEQIKKALAKQKAESELLNLQNQLKKKNKKLLKMKELEVEIEELKKKQDIKSLLKEGMHLVQNFKTGTPPPLQGTPENNTEVEVEIAAENEETQADKFYHQLLEKYKEKEVIEAIKTWRVFTQYPELKEEFGAIINQKIKNNGKA
jgi:acylphosphatase